jgi:bis(5'-nucleosyl)-tetraphosphatase (symmetrical)
MIYLVGDVQGCDDALQRLLQLLAFSPSRDRLVLLGDLVNRGPASLAVLRRVSAFGDAATSLLGNHDLHLLAVAHGVRSLHKGDSFDDVLRASDAPAWIEWVRRQRLAHLESGWLCVHAGVVPQWSTRQTLELASEVETLLQGPDLAAFLLQMYGNEPDRWSDSLSGHLRARFVINALTRLRFCTADGQLDFKTKDGAGAAPPGFMPWFAAPGRATAQQPIAFGHWSTLGLINEPTLLATDTGCVWGGSLTAIRVDGGRREVMQVPCDQARTPGA